MPKSRVISFVDKNNRLIIFRFIGSDENETAGQALSIVLENLDCPWEYDFLFDLHRSSKPIDSRHIAAFGKYLLSLMKGRDKGRATLVISQDPQIWSRDKMYEEATPWRCHRMFTSLDESLDWLRARDEQSLRSA